MNSTGVTTRYMVHLKWGSCISTVYPKKYAHSFVVLCFVVVMQSFIMNSHEVFIHIHQGCFAGTGAIVRLPQCQWSKPDGYGKISQCITTTKHSKAKTVCIFLGIYCRINIPWMNMFERSAIPKNWHLHSLRIYCLSPNEYYIHILYSIYSLCFICVFVTLKEQGSCRGWSEVDIELMIFRLRQHRQMSSTFVSRQKLR